MVHISRIISCIGAAQSFPTRYNISPADLRLPEDHPLRVRYELKKALAEPLIVKPEDLRIVNQPLFKLATTTTTTTTSTTETHKTLPTGTLSTTSQWILMAGAIATPTVMIGGLAIHALRKYKRQQTRPPKSAFSDEYSCSDDEEEEYYNSPQFDVLRDDEWIFNAPATDFQPSRY